jgi:hypothetical protein
MYVASRLYSPSYVSLETALSNYSIIPEVSMAVTSVTTKPTRTFKNQHGLFIYRTVKPACFSGYYVAQVSGFPVLIAEPEKAVVDYLHFKTYRKKEFVLPDERFDKGIISGLNTKKLNKYASLFNMDLGGFYAQL